MPYRYDVTAISATGVGEEVFATNGKMLPLDILWAGGVDRTLFYKWERESRGLSVGHLVEYIDPLQPLVPRVLDLSSSTQFMNAELEDERSPPWGVGDRLIFVQRGAADVSGRHKASCTLGFTRRPPGAYWGCTSRIIILIRRDLQLVRDRTRITIPWTAFLKLLAYTPETEGVVQQQRAAFQAGQIPSYADQEAFLARLPDDPCPGIYGVFRVVDGVPQLAELDPADPIRTEYSRTDSSDESGGDRGGESGEDSDNEVGSQADSASQGITRSTNPRRRHPNADMTDVAPRFDPGTFEPNPALLVISPHIWHDPNDRRPWAVLREEWQEYIAARAAHFAEVDATAARQGISPDPAVLAARAATDKLLTERLRRYTNNADRGKSSARTKKAASHPRQAPGHGAAVSQPKRKRDPASPPTRTARLPASRSSSSRGELLGTSSSASSLPGVVPATGTPDSGSQIAATALETAAAALEPLGATTPAFRIVAEQLRSAAYGLRLARYN